MIAALAASCATSRLSLDADAARAGDLKASVTTPLKGERFDIAGVIGSTGPRRVVLEERTDDGWSPVPGRRTTASATGAFSFQDLQIGGPTQFRVRAAAATVNGVKRTATITTPLSLQLASRGQRATLRTLPEIAGRPTDRPASMSAATGVLQARFSPARPGRAVEFAGRVGSGKWRVIGRAEQDDEGNASIQFADPSAASEWRARAVATNGAKAFDVIREPSPWKEKFASGFSEKRLPADWDYRQFRSWLPSRTCMLITEDGAQFNGSVAGITTPA